MGDAPDLAITPARDRYSLFQSLVLRQLFRMKRGALTIVLPNRERVRVGEGVSIRAEIRIHDPSFFKKCVLYGDIGFGESYVDGDWTTDSITDVISWFIHNVDEGAVLSGSRRKWSVANLLETANRWYHRTRENTMAMARRNISAHYDLSNDLFACFLDPSMTYSSAYFREDRMTLEQAQHEKYDRLCRLLHLQRSHHVLEIGSGWGGFAIHAAQRYGCRVTTITLSAEQQALAVRRIGEAGLSDRIAVQLRDYRSMQGTFDRIVSIEMLEAVGHEYLPVFFRTCQSLLASNGLMGLQVIVSPDSRYREFRRGVDWIQKHIFPGSLLPSIAAINNAINRTGTMHLHDLKSFGAHYARTLAVWRDRFNENLGQVRRLGFDDRFIRKWNYYLSYCEAAFRMRNIDVVQMVYTRPNNTAWSS